MRLLFGLLALACSSVGGKKDDMRLFCVVEEDTMVERCAGALVLLRVGSYRVKKEAGGYRQ